MRTHVITTIELPTNSAALVRKPVQPGDKLLFQTDSAEVTLTATSVQTEPGLMKGWALVHFEKEVSNG